MQEVIPLATPFLLYADPSSACNFRCNFCPTGHRDLTRDPEAYRRSIMPLAVFEKLVADLADFPEPIRALRLNKIGEPLLNKSLPRMIRLAKDSGRVAHVDLATNAALLTPARGEALVEAGLDRINISLEGMSAAQYRTHAKVEIDFDGLVKQIAWFYRHRGDCEVTIKIPGDYLSAEDQQRFFDTFGDHCDRIFVEGLAPIWPGFDLESRAGVALNRERGQYQQQLESKDVCAYIFYAMAINADGTVSACCPDWGQQQLIGDLRTQSLREIWNAESLRALRLQHLSGRRCDNSTCRDCGHLQYAQIDNIDPYRDQLLERLSLPEKVESGA
ncbi:radical SAM/SPASM domain-containing protein [Marichromatium gracile]|uniref:radical SAM/SPASM domain-containing protein n=1 Tax=Marichromatium gracile TaxID=1048 RepID=UPI001A9397DD|nr:radical SAM/SPASM domain-containing protein [Marichromatium gracile]